MLFDFLQQQKRKDMKSFNMNFHLQAHLKATPADAQTKAFKRACKDQTQNQ